MKIVVHNFLDHTDRTFDGTPEQVKDELLRAYPFLRSEYPETQGEVEDLVDHLNSEQTLEADITDDEYLDDDAEEEITDPSSPLATEPVLLRAVGRPALRERALRNPNVTPAVLRAAFDASHGTADANEVLATILAHPACTDEVAAHIHDSMPADIEDDEPAEEGPADPEAYVVHKVTR